MDITTASPAEIDARNAELYEAQALKTQYRNSAIDSVHRSVEGDRKVTYMGRKRVVAPWKLTDEEALNGQALKSYDQSGLDYSKNTFHRAVDALRAIIAESDSLEHEFQRRGGWTRFFFVQGGHIHSSMNCSTCNNGKSFTQFGWLPQYSGKSEKEMIDGLRAEKGGSATIMCTVCYPSAPTEWTEKPVDNSVCEGSKTYGYDRKTARTGYYRGNAGTCDVCGDRVTLTPNGALRTHKTKVSA